MPVGAILALTAVFVVFFGAGVHVAAVLGLLDDLDRNRFIVFRSLTLLRRLALAPALVDAGWSLTRIGVVTSVVASVPALAAALAGGRMCRRWAGRTARSKVRRR